MLKSCIQVHYHVIQKKVAAQTAFQILSEREDTSWTQVIQKNLTAFAQGLHLQNFLGSIFQTFRHINNKHFVLTFW